MKRKIFIVLGLGFGDEGKGLTTDFLALQKPNSLVIRFNGGQQAGHTVWKSNNEHHVFSNFGAGSLRNIPTYWSKYCTFSPASFCKEWDSLQHINPDTRIFIDNMSPLSTHYDQLYNRVLEEQRGSARHGSCGLGFGATIERHHHSPIKLFAQDLAFPETLLQKLKAIKNYYEQKFLENKLDFFNNLPHQTEDERFLHFAEKINKLIEQKNLIFANETSILKNGLYENLIFEGAQGILLDMDFGLFPNVTRSNTTSKNALNLIKRNHLEGEISIWYVSRTYLTRHGAGFFPNENTDLKLQNTAFETNQYNDFQGNFRKAPLHLPLLNYALTCDANFSEGIEKSLMLTCADQLPDQEACTIYSDKIEEISVKKLKKHLQERFENVFVSYNKCAEFL